MNQYDYNNQQYIDYQQSSPYSTYSSQYQTNFHQQMQQQEQQTPYESSNYQQPTQYSAQNSLQYQTYQQPQQDFGYNPNANNQSWNITQNKASYIVSIHKNCERAKIVMGPTCVWKYKKLITVCPRA